MSLALFFGVLVLLLVLTVPICVSFAFVTLLPSIVDASFPYTADAAVRSMVSGLNNFPLLAIPLFIIAGVIMAKGQISERLFNVFSYFVGNRTAGLPCAVTITCLFYGAISGSGPATTAAVGSMCIPLLTSVGYDLTFATALVAVSGSLGIIIPPSIPYIMYCNASGASISELFLAGFLPGVLIALCLMVYSYIYCKIHGEDKDKLNAKCMELRAKGLGTVLKEGFWALMSPVIILGGIYGGICSPTEAATISIFYSLIVSLFIYRTIKIRDLPKIMLEGIHSYAPILIILSAAVAFARVITLMNVATIVSEAVLSAISSKVVILLLINVLLLFVGMIMDTGPAILVFTPVLLPVAEAPLAIIQGPAGTAKTFYALAAGLEQVLEAEERPYRKILVCRPNAQFDADIGFLPGSEQEKISPLMRPIVDNLEILLDLEGKKKERRSEEELRGRIDYLFDTGVIQGDLLGPVGTDIIAGGGRGALLAGGPVRGGQLDRAGGRVEGHVHTHGLADGPDGDIGGAVVEEHGDLLSGGIPRGESGAVEGDADAVLHLDAALGGGGGRDAQCCDQDRQDQTGAEALPETVLLHCSFSFSCSAFGGSLPPLLHH